MGCQRLVHNVLCVNIAQNLYQGLGYFQRLGQGQASVTALGHYRGKRTLTGIGDERQVPTTVWQYVMNPAYAFHAVEP